MDNIKNFIGTVITTNKTSLPNSSTDGDRNGRQRSESLCSNASDVSTVSMNSITDGRKIERKDSKDNEPYFYIIYEDEETSYAEHLSNFIRKRKK